MQSFKPRASISPSHWPRASHQPVTITATLPHVPDPQKPRNPLEPTFPRSRGPILAPLHALPRPSPRSPPNCAAKPLFDVAHVATPPTHGKPEKWSNFDTSAPSGGRAPAKIPRECYAAPPAADAAPGAPVRP
ncbi:hypothetical protein Zmor_027824 [Zophobas morio]|uniref:Uncharacterized protein n=1 Tax=Zophobas morio TaxID=2755281 RepID=A0AA38HRJ7_9CUCU|nr:hypothetical protein Zmor_027824 [Zophobas morio]